MKVGTDILLLPDEQEFLAEKARLSSNISEWGSGGSTILMLRATMGNVTSFEHSRKWYEKVSANVLIEPEHVWKRLTYNHVPTEMPYGSGDRDDMDLQYYAYATPNEELPAFNKSYIDPEKNLGVTCFDADLYLVDGISRGACLATIFAKARNREATVLLHDHVGREEWYSWATQLYPVRENGPDNFLVLRMK